MEGLCLEREVWSQWRGVEASVTLLCELGAQGGFGFRV